MVKVTICIGSSCHLKGSRQIVEQMQYLISNGNYGESIELAGAFCMGKCASEGVSVTVDGEYYAVKPENATEFFNSVILSKLPR